MTSPDTRTLVELDGEVTQLQALQSVAPACLSYPLIFSKAKIQLEVGALLRRVSYDES